MSGTLVSNTYNEQTSAVAQAAMEEVHQRTALETLEEQTVIEDMHPEEVEAREKAAAEEMLREIEASLGNVKKRNTNRLRMPKSEKSLLGKRGRPRGSKNHKPRTQKDPLLAKPVAYKKPKVDRSPIKKKQRSPFEENTIIFQQVPQGGAGEQHTIMTANGQQIQFQAGGQAQQFFTVPRIMSPQQGMSNITDQNVTLNQTNLMAFVQSSQNRATEDNMRNLTVQAQVSYT